MAGFGKLRIGSGVRLWAVQTVALQIRRLPDASFIKAEWPAMREADPSFAPAWSAAHDPVMRKPLEEATCVWVTEQPAADHLDLANAIYGSMVAMLSQSFGGPGDATERKLLMSASVEMMEASAAVSTSLARLPANSAYPDVNAGMTFAIPRNIGPRAARDKARACSSNARRNCAPALSAC